MTNAKQEFLRLIGGLNVLCADIFCKPLNDEDDSAKAILLPCGYTDEEFEQFLDKLDFEYDDGYGSQKLFGIVWFTTNVWAERGEYDGSEWWEIIQEPTIPDYLLSK